jgi:D-alanyl-D-alanine carboxypeptidase
VTSNTKISATERRRRVGQPRAVAVAAALVAAAAAMASPAPAQRGNPTVRQGGQSIDEMVAELMRDEGVPGIALAIVQAPYVTRAVGYGVSDPATGRLVSPNTLFRVDGLARAYLGVAVVQLVEAGKLRLDEPVEARLDDAPADVTVAELLGRRPAAVDARLLRRLVEKVSGQDYEAFVREQQIDRLGLTHTFFASELASVAQERLAPGDRHGAFLRERPLVDPTEVAIGSDGEVAAETGTLYASAVDVSLWDIALAGELLIRDPELRKVLYLPRRDASGRPAATTGVWDFPGHPGLMVVAGSGGGSSALLSRFTDPQELVCVTLLANRADVDLTQLARRIAGAFDPRLGPPERAAGKRVQQSPYPLEETRRRVAEAFGGPAPPPVEVWEEQGGEVWVAVADPVVAGHGSGDERAAQLRQRSGIDAALLRAVSP